MAEQLEAAPTTSGEVEIQNYTFLLVRKIVV